MVRVIIHFVYIRTAGLAPFPFFVCASILFTSCDAEFSFGKIVRLEPVGERA